MLRTIENSVYKSHIQAEHLNDRLVNEKREWSLEGFPKDVAPAKDYWVRIVQGMQNTLTLAFQKSRTQFYTCDLASQDHKPHLSLASGPCVPAAGERMLIIVSRKNIEKRKSFAHTRAKRTVP